jgi:hypothetical protein
MKAALVLVLASLPPMAGAQSAVSLPKVTVNSPRVANQVPAGAMAMPVSALRFEPQVDIQGRNLAEGQSDVTIRGGIFENTGFKLGAITLLDPQTGHYFAEIPVAPAMLGTPEIVTGANLALSATNSTVGAVAYGWRPVLTTGALSLAWGSNGHWRTEAYQGLARDAQVGRWQFASDVAVAHSESNGSIPFGEHRFDRVNLRLQLAGNGSQTDLFAGYQAKFFGWPNLYTPFNSNETENLQTVLIALNHRSDLSGGDFFEAGVFYRRNKDDYAFNRFAAVGAVHPFQHTTWVTGAAVSGRRMLGELALNARAEVLADELRSTSLTFGSFQSRTLTKLGFVPGKSWRTADGNRTILKVGATYDDTNRGVASLAPVVEVAREFSSATLRRIYASYTKTTQTPTYTALNSNSAAGLFRGNPTLGRESSRNFEVGASGAVAGWSAEVAAFFRRDDALVDWTFRHGVTARTANPVDIAVGGAEAVVRRSWATADVVLGYTVLTKDADYRGAAVDASFYALNYARHRFTAAFTFRLGRDVELRMDNVARWQAANPLRVAGGHEAIVTSAGVAYRPPAARKLELSLQVDNLWNSDFQEVPAVPAARRQVSAGLAYAW